MRILFLLPLLAFIVSNTVKAQSIEHFLTLRKNNIEEVNNKLKKSGWYLSGENEQQKNGLIIYTYKSSNNTKSALNIQWINYVNCSYYSNKNRLSFQVQNENLFEQYTSEIKSLGFYSLYQKDADGNDIILYSNNEDIIEVTETKNKSLCDGVICYNFTFYDKSEYEIVFKEENPLENNPYTNISLYNSFK